MDHFAHFGPENKLKRVQITPQNAQNMLEFALIEILNNIQHFTSRVQVYNTSSIQVYNTINTLIDVSYSRRSIIVSAC